jgi:hypothetical protein
MPTAGFETATPASKRPQTHALDCAATGIGLCIPYIFEIWFLEFSVNYWLRRTGKAAEPVNSKGGYGRNELAATENAHRTYAITEFQPRN